MLLWRTIWLESKGQSGFGVGPIICFVYSLPLTNVSCKKFKSNITELCTVAPDRNGRLTRTNGNGFPYNKCCFECRVAIEDLWIKSSERRGDERETFFHSFHKAHRNHWSLPVFAEFN